MSYPTYRYEVQGETFWTLKTARPAAEEWARVLGEEIEIVRIRRPETITVVKPRVN